MLRPVRAHLVDICGQFGLEWDIKFNSSNSQTVTFGGVNPHSNTYSNVEWYNNTTVNIKYFSQLQRSSKQLKRLINLSELFEVGSDVVDCRRSAESADKHLLRLRNQLYSIVKTVYIGWSDVTVIYGHDMISMLWQDVVLCEVNWWRFVTLFKQGVAPTKRNTTGPPCSVTVEL